MNALDKILVFTEHYGMGDADNHDIAIDIEGMAHVFFRDAADVHSKFPGYSPWPSEFSVLAQTRTRDRMLQARRVLLLNGLARKEAEEWVPGRTK